MPSKRCDACNRLHRISTSEYRYLDTSGGDYCCSVDCVLDWIRKFDTSWCWKSIDGVYEVRDSMQPEQYYSRVLNMNFRSKYEGDVATTFAHRKLPFRYEPYLFQITDTKYYTPDFFMPTTGCCEEVKGKWGIGQQSKLELFREKFPLIPLLVVPWVLNEEFCGESDKVAALPNGAAERYRHP